MKSAVFWSGCQTSTACDRFFLNCIVKRGFTCRARNLRPFSCHQTLQWSKTLLISSQNAMVTLWFMSALATFSFLNFFAECDNIWKSYGFVSLLSDIWVFTETQRSRFRNYFFTVFVDFQIVLMTTSRQILGQYVWYFKSWCTYFLILVRSFKYTRRSCFQDILRVLASGFCVHSLTPRHGTHLHCLCRPLLAPVLIVLWKCLLRIVACHWFACKQVSWH